MDTLLSGNRICRVFDRVVAERGHRKRILTNNAPEFAGKALPASTAWSCSLQPGKPAQNEFIESFIGTMRNDYLNEHRFLDLADARELIEAWRLVHQYPAAAQFPRWATP